MFKRKANIKIVKSEIKADNLVSVVVPVYNVAHYLDRCIESIVTQTYENLEIILIEDGSTDGSLEKCYQWSQKDKRIILYSKKNEGLGPARNDGIEKATGKYIAFIDADDWWEQNTIESLYRSAEENNADMVYMNFYWEYRQGDGSYKRREFCQYCLFDGMSNAEAQPDLVFSSDARTWSKFYRLKLFKDNNIRFPSHPFEDFPVNPLLVLAAERISQVHQPLYHYDCNRTGNLTGEASSYLSIVQGLKELYSSLEKRGYLDRYIERYRKYAICLCRDVLNENRITNAKDVGKYFSFLREYCGREMRFYWTEVSYLGSFGGYQIIQKNTFHSRIKGVQIKGVPEGYNDILGRAREKIGDVCAGKFLFVDLLMPGENEIEEDYCQEIAGELRDITTAHGYQGKIVLLKLYFSEKHGISAEQNVYFENIEEIRRRNKMLQKQYKVLENWLAERCISIGFEELNNYSYEYTPYGCKSEYYNGRFYDKAFEKIERILMKADE